MQNVVTLDLDVVSSNVFEVLQVLLNLLRDVFISNPVATSQI